jgi:ribosomal protein S18 acetylase RimI-like enzyme
VPQPPQLEILDLRHFSASQLRPLLRDEADHWQQRLHWDYTRAAQMLLEYLDGRVLPGFVALRNGVIQGYGFCVYEADKAVIGDIYAFHETASTRNPICETLLHHLIELLQNTPGVSRIESQLLMFPAGSLHTPFLAAGFRSFPRLFMLCDLHRLTTSPTPSVGKGPGAPHLDSEMWEPQEPGAPQKPGAPFITRILRDEWDSTKHLILPWQPEFHTPAAALIQRAYQGHMDANLNDQYRTLAGAERFLNNIVRFPGAGTFDPEHSLVLRDPNSAAIVGLILCSRVRSDTAHITQLCIDPTLRGQGLGHLLLRHCATHLLTRGVTRLSLTVTAANLPALRLYEDLGFTTVHRFEAMIWDTHHESF